MTVDLRTKRAERQRRYALVNSTSGALIAVLTIPPDPTHPVVLHVSQAGPEPFYNSRKGAAKQLRLWRHWFSNGSAKIVREPPLTRIGAA